MTTWSKRTSWDAVCRRASGRRRYNSVRQLRALLRQIEVARLLRTYHWARGARARIARELGVTPGTITRDVQSLLARHTPWKG